MTIARNLYGKDIPTELIRTLEQMDTRMRRLEQLLATKLASGANGDGGLTAAQQQDVLRLVAGRSSAVIGQETTDPFVVGLPTSSGTVTSFSAGDLSPLFTTGEATPTTTPALSFAQVNQAANIVFVGPASGAAAAPTFRALVANDLPTAAVKSTASKTTAGAPYANDGYVDATVNGVAVRLMTTA